MATTKRISYNAKITLVFNYNGNSVNIDPIKISYIMIDSDYENNVMPIIYMSLLANDNEYKVYNENKDNGTFSLTIKKYAINSNTSIEKVVISDVFSYIPSTSSANMMEDINKSDDLGSSYRKIMIGLVSTQLTNKLRKSFNGIYKKIDQTTLVTMALEGLNPVLEQLTYNESYSSIIIPPISTRYQLLNFVFNKDPFYDTQFRFFMDYNRTYLLSKKGNSISAGDGKPNDVILDIVSITSNEAMYEGMAITDGSYYIYINPADAKLVDNEAQEKIVNNVTIVDEDKGTTDVDLDYNTTNKSNSTISSKKTYIRYNNANLIKNELELGKSTIELIKRHIDGSEITPNKCYTVKNFQENKKEYDGKYILAYKREFFKSNVADFQMSVNLGLKKVGKLNAIKTPSTANGKSYTKSINTSTSSTATKKTTASKVNSLKSSLIK
jgi:hypothetical protein